MASVKNPEAHDVDPMMMSDSQSPVKGLIDNKDSALTTSTKPYRLHVYNIDPEINEQAIRNCFSKFGKIVDIDLCQQKNMNGKLWANIVFSTQKEAQSALEELNGVPPYQFKIRPGLTGVDKAKRKEEYRETFQDPLKDAGDLVYLTKGIGLMPINLGHANRLAPLALASAPAIFPNNPLQVLRVDDPRFSEDQIVPISSSSPINLDMLQSKTWYNLICEPSPPGQCRFCKESGRLRCSKCKAWYCSLKCQQNHWQIHRLECEPIPPLETDDGLPPPRGVNTGWKPSSVKKVCQSSSVKNQSPVKYSKLTPLKEPELKLNDTSCHRKNLVPANQEETQKLKVKEEKNIEMPKSTKNKTVELKTQEEAQSVPKCNETNHLVKDQRVSQGTDSYLKTKSQETPAQVKEKIGEISSRCVKLDPMTEKVAEILKNTVEVKVVSPSSILDSIEPGLYDFMTEPEKSALQFFGMLYFEKVASYILDSFQEEIKSNLNKPMDVKAGNFVVFRIIEEGSEMFYRGFVIDQDKEKKVWSLVNIDFASKVEVKLEDLFEIPSKALNLPTLGLKMTIANPTLKPEEQKVISKILSEENVSIKIKDNKEVLIGQTPQAKAILCGGQSTEVTSYLAHSWTSVDTRIPALLGIKDLKTLRKNFKELQLKDGSSVVILELGTTTNTVIIQTEESLEISLKLEEALETQLSLEQVPLTDLVTGEIVACKWSESGCFYRAEITEIDSQKKRVTVCFVDYGNHAVESFEHVIKLPDLVADPDKYPICAQILTLSDVPKLETASVQSQLNELKPELTQPFKAKFSDDKATVQLMHADGGSLNKIIRDKLEPPNQVAMEGQTVGGGFKYDRCHIAQLPINPDMEQNVILLGAESPKKVFLGCPDEIALASTIEEQCLVYSQAAVGSSNPPSGSVCVAKGSDESWYRGVVVKELDDTSSLIFFPDYGFEETVLHIDIRHMTEELMETPFLANHCIVENFEQVTDEAVLDKATKLLQNLEESSEIKIIALCRDKNSCVTIRIPSIAKDLEAILTTGKRDIEEKKKLLEEEQRKDQILKEKKQQLLKEEELKKKRLLEQEELKKKRLLEQEELKKKRLLEEEMKKKQLQEEKEKLLEKEEAARQIKELEEKLALLKRKM